MKYTLLKNKVTGVRSVRINTTGELVLESEDPNRYADLRKKAETNRRSAAKHDAYTSCGLERVRSASGKVYYE